MALHLRVDRDTSPDSSLLLAAEVIQAGGIIVYPTETVYGIGANAWNSQAVARVQEIKLRKEPKPILLVVDSIEAACGVTEEVTPLAQKFIRAFWPGPLTLVMRASMHLPESLTLGRGTVGVRVPSNTLCLRLLTLCGCPLTSTSANRSGEPTPATAEEIEDCLSSGIDLFLNAGALRSDVPSTVLDVTGPRPRLVREGAIRLEQLLSVSPTIDR